MKKSQLKALATKIHGQTIFKIVGMAVVGVMSTLTYAVSPPYPPSSVITAISWAPTSSIVQRATDSDNWPSTWADDDTLYTAYGDGWGFDPKVSTKLSLGFAKVQGPATGFTGINIRSPTGEQTSDGAAGKKASGMLMVNGVLYMWVRNVDLNGNQSQLAWSSDHAVTWTWSSWKFTEFGYTTFLNFGKNYAGARDGYVYSYSPDTASAYVGTDRFVLMRVPANQITTHTAYQFFKGLDASGNPIWTASIAERGAVFTHLGRSLRSGISYNAALKRYLWWQMYYQNGVDNRFSGGFGIYDAPEPWGPWTTVYFTTNWDVGPGETGSFPTKWMSIDGKTLYLVFSGNDAFSVRKATLNVAPFKQSSAVDGIVSIDTEHFHGAVSQGGHLWDPVTSPGGYSGNGAMVANPNNGANVDTGYTTGSPRLDYQARFAKTGTHYLWIRGSGAAGADDSCHAGLDGAAIATSDRITGFPLSWTWSRSTMDGPVATFNVATSGVHTVNVWMREDGFKIDKLVITTNASYVPSGTGPAESLRQ
jgi:glycosyl hydrolase family 115